jgi:hypothetical protein
MKDNYNGVLQMSIKPGLDQNPTVYDMIKGIDLSGKTSTVTGVMPA